MVHDTRRVNRIGIAQGVYYLMTALLPFLSLRTFIAVTGPKTDVWLVKTVGALLVVIGIALIVGSNSEEIKPNTICLGVFSALALALIDIYYALRKIISKIYRRPAKTPCAYPATVKAVLAHSRSPLYQPSAPRPFGRSQRSKYRTHVQSGAPPLAPFPMSPSPLAAPANPSET
jgi:hypothetical protein